MDSLPNVKKAFIQEFLNRPVIARIATADKDGQPHVVPVWFGWDGESLWISAFADTRKVQELNQNPLISVAIDETEGANGSTKAVIMEGRAVLHHPLDEELRGKVTWIYARYVGDDHIQEKTYQDWIHDPLNTLIQLTPTKVFSWQW